ncbi:hypothetical protein [Hungatella hathewayi]|uniref:hypothetical protein n=1 Tax=Hungatella hathewayi TaxID=154046 RepID=UPI0003377ECB|nr:hypothetical protein [Hungatella hathewayi]CCZ61228.1 unknown [Hungatella hathewayi CAG:224]
MTDIKEQWENYIELGEKVVKEKGLKEEFEKEIKAYSSFLSETNQDYYYNSTYLPHYSMEFLHFLECFYKKYELVKRIFELSSSYSGVSLIIDRYWQQESKWDDEEEKIVVINKVYSFSDKNTVCDEKLLIECSALCETKRFIYHSKAGINESEEQKELKNLKEFLDFRTYSKNRKNGE